MNKTLSLVAALMMALPLLSSVVRAADNGYRTVEIVVTNLTKGQIISPPVVASHRDGFELFQLGHPASPELAGLAEDAATDPLVAALRANRRVLDVAVGGGPILPGQSARIRIRTRGSHDRITVAGMLVTTNDTFFAVRGAQAPRSGKRTLRSPGYDAGSEENNESCTYIPGPPCGNGGVRTTASEGYVYIGNGIHGIGNLRPSEFHWLNPVADVTLREVH
ncbi:MAG: hypothetical protein HOP14_05730 [Acidobacteria bacterium]|nr:hypothetical protein [Acidobacteriota bacterium]